MPERPGGRTELVSSPVPCEITEKRLPLLDPPNIVVAPPQSAMMLSGKGSCDAGRGTHRRIRNRRRPRFRRDWSALRPGTSPKTRSGSPQMLNTRFNRNLRRRRAVTLPRASKSNPRAHSQSDIQPRRWRSTCILARKGTSGWAPIATTALVSSSINASRCSAVKRNRSA